MPENVVLSGELGLLSLFDLGQLFMLNRATGELTVASEGLRGYFYFEQGQIVNAVDDEYHEGEGAAYKLFTWKTGTFEFKAEPPTGAHTIVESTEGLMMEAARRMDELGTGDAGGEADRLARRASSFDALRVAFQSLASQARPLPASDDPDSAPFDLLREPSDALLFRPNHLPRARLSGHWRGAGAQPIERAAFQQLRARLQESLPGGPRTGVQPSGVTTWSVEHEDGRRYAVTCVGGEHEALWIRAAALPPPELERFEGRHDELREALAEPAGLLLVCGPDVESTEMLFHACVARLAQERAGTVLLATDHGRWLHEDRSGVLVRSGEGDVPALLGTLAPEIAAFDHAHAPLSLDALNAAERVVVAVTSRDPAHALAHWCARVGRHLGDGIEALLADAPVIALHTSGARTAEGLVPFAVITLRSSDTAPPPRAPLPEFVAPSAPAAATPSSAEPPAPPSSDPMAALAAELTRTLKKARKAA